MHYLWSISFLLLILNIDKPYYEHQAWGNHKGKGSPIIIDPRLSFETSLPISSCVHWSWARCLMSYGEA